MKYAILFAATATLALAACSKGDDASPAASESAVAVASETAAAMPAGAVPMAAGAAPTEDYLVGTWGEAPDCKQPITFAAGGKITNGPFDTWTLKDGKLTMGGAISMMLSVVDDKTMKSKNDGGGEATLMRCK